jgi:hypothetical protein
MIGEVSESPVEAEILERICGLAKLVRLLNQHLAEGLAQMEAKKKKLNWGNLLIWIGSIWFVFTFFWLPPLMIILGVVDPWLRFPDNVGSVILRAEFAVAAATTAAGILLRLSANRKLSIAHYIVAFGAAAIPVLLVFVLYGWIHLFK